MTAVKVVDWPCHAHTLCKPDDELTKATPNANAFRKYFNKGIMFRGKMFGLVKKVFGVSPLVAGGVRWYIVYEQCKQINEFGVEEILNRVIPTCLKEKYSEKSVNKLLDSADKLNLGKEIVEFAIVA